MSHAEPRPELILRLVAEKDHPHPWNAARSFLKALLRSYGWKCTAILPELPTDAPGDAGATIRPMRGQTDGKPAARQLAQSNAVPGQGAADATGNPASDAPGGHQGHATEDQAAATAPGTN